MKHYRIRQLDEGGFFIARRTTFRSLQELVEHYTKDADGLCVNLRKACIQVSGVLTVTMIGIAVGFDVYVAPKFCVCVCIWGGGCESVSGCICVGGCL